MTAVRTRLMSDEEVAAYGFDPDAGYGALRTERGVLPLVAMEVDARVVGVIATIEVAQTFVNTTGLALEATYIFPLPDRAAVHRFQMVVGGRVIDGVLDERGAARAQYDQAIAAGHHAAITEEERPGVFTLRVGNLMPGEAAIVRLSLVGALPVDDGEVTFRFPLVVAPRYLPGAQLAGDQAGLGTAADTDRVPDASRISPPVRLPGCPYPVRLGLRVALADGVVRDVASSLHSVVVAHHDAQIVEVRPGERLDRDFLLRWRIDSAQLHSSLVCAPDASGSGGTFALTLVPPATTTVAARPRDVVFVLDRSGSMAGWKMVAARRAAARMIDTLTSRDRFCAIAFDNLIDLVPGTGLVEATDRNRFRAVEALAKIEARGGTEIAVPLRLALGMLVGGTADRERVIMLVTDGQVGNEIEILRELAPALRNIKMFTLGIDRAVNAAFLHQLAAAGGGLCELVESEDRLDEVMTKVHRRIGTPLATELALRATGLEVDRATFAPAKLPDVYAGAPVVVLGRFRGPVPPGATIEVEGTSLGDPLRMSVAATLAPAPASWLAASWARAHLRDLEDRYAARASGELEHQIVQVSKQFSVLSRFTAFVAIDRSQVANPRGVLHQVVQPVERPAGWDEGGGRGVGAVPPPSARSRTVLAGGSLRMPGAAPAPAPEAMSVRRASPGDGRSEAIRGVPPSPAGESGPPSSGGYGAPAGASSHAPAPASPAALESMPRRDVAARSVASASMRSRGEEGPREEGASRAVSAVNVVYLKRLAQLAVELEAQAKGAVNTTAIRLLRQRLAQWSEDVRASGHAALADAVDRLVQPLSVALGQPAELQRVAGEVSEALALLAAGGAPPVAPPPSRVAFWK